MARRRHLRRVSDQLVRLQQRRDRKEKQSAATFNFCNIYDRLRVRCSQALHLENVQVPLFQAKIQELLSSLHSRVRFTTLQLPLAVVTATNRPAYAVSTDNPHGQDVNGPAAAIIRLYTEETAGVS